MRFSGFAQALSRRAAVILCLPLPACGSSLGASETASIAAAPGSAAAVLSASNSAPAPITAWPTAKAKAVPSWSTFSKGADTAEAEGGQ